MSFVTAAVIGGVATVGAAGINAYSANQMGKAGGQTGGMGVTTMPQYSWTEPTQRLTADYVSQNVQRMSEGKNPAWYDKLAPQIQQGLQTQNYQNFFGTPGQRNGIVNEAVSGGAGAGLGKGATSRRKWTALQDYSNKSSLIDQYMATQNMSMMQNQSTAWPQMATQLPSGPNSVASPYGYQTPGQTNQWGALANTAAGSIPWENMFSSGTPTTSSAYGYSGQPQSWGSPTTNQNYNMVNGKIQYGVPAIG